MEIKVLSSIEKTAKTGRLYKAIEVFVEGETRKVNIFSSAPNFDNIMQGSTIIGTMAFDGKYWNINFDGQKPAMSPTGGYKAAQIEKVMEKKNESIGKFQDNKEYSIKVASTIRLAVDCALAELKDETVLDTLEEGITKWRRYFWEHWDVDEKQFSPF